MGSEGQRGGALTVEQIAAAKRWFESVDRDRDGQVHLAEIAELARRAGGPSEAGLAGIDVESGGHITLAEWLALTSALKSDALLEAMEQDAQLREAFARYDSDGDGHITAVEFRALAASLGQDITEEQAEEMVCALDTDGDGQIDFAEFSKVPGE